MKFYTNCNCCGKRIAENGKFIDEEGNAYCNKCGNELSTPCLKCGDVHPMYDMVCNDNSEYFCDNCFNC